MGETLPRGELAAISAEAGQPAMQVPISAWTAGSALMSEVDALLDAGLLEDLRCNKEVRAACLVRTASVVVTGSAAWTSSIRFAALPLSRSLSQCL